MSELNCQRRGSASGKDSSLVLFLHGYGANGADLLGIGEHVAPLLPDTVFVAVDAPTPSVANPAGFQWFPIPWLDGSTEAAMVEELVRSARLLDAFISRLLADEGLDPGRLLLFGFSQGTMMSLHVAPRRIDPVAGIVGVSGRLMFPGCIADEAKSRPPALLVHGDVDEVVPFAELGAATEALQAAGFEVSSHVMEGTGHGISPDGLSVALKFMRERLGVEPPGS